MSVIWPGGKHSSRSLGDAKQILIFFFPLVELKSDHHISVLTLPISQVF